MTTQGHHLEVPGASLYYEVAGSGPLLALVGMPMTGDWFAPLVGQLTSDFTVLTLDPRGFGRSPIDDPEQDAVPAESAEDLAELLRAVGDGPAYVLGSSGGAVTGLELVAAYPELVDTLIGHEPPVTAVLPDADEVDAMTTDVVDTFREHGPGPAFAKFMVVVDPDAPPQDPGEAGPPSSEQAQADGVRMLRHSLLPVTRYRPELDVLRKAAPRVVLGYGSASSERAVARRAALALAAEIEAEVVEFPGGHGGFLPPEMGGDPAGFAQVVRTVLR